MAQTKALANVITEMLYSAVAEMYTNNSSKFHLGSILANSAACHNCKKIQENALLTDPQID